VQSVAVCCKCVAVFCSVRKRSRGDMCVMCVRCVCDVCVMCMRCVCEVHKCMV